MQRTHTHTPQPFGPLAIRLESLRKYEFKILQTNWISTNFKRPTTTNQSQTKQSAGSLYSNVQMKFYFQLNACLEFLWCCDVVIWNKIYELRTWCQLYGKYECLTANDSIWRREKITEKSSTNPNELTSCCWKQFYKCARKRNVWLAKRLNFDFDFDFDFFLPSNLQLRVKTTAALFSSKTFRWNQ